MKDTVAHFTVLVPFFSNSRVQFQFHWHFATLTNMFITLFSISSCFFSRRVITVNNKSTTELQIEQMTLEHYHNILWKLLFITLHTEITKAKDLSVGRWGDCTWTALSTRDSCTSIHVEVLKWRNLNQRDLSEQNVISWTLLLYSSCFTKSKFIWKRDLWVNIQIRPPIRKHQCSRFLKFWSVGSSPDSDLCVKTDEFQVSCCENFFNFIYFILTL